MSDPVHHPTPEPGEIPDLEHGVTGIPEGDPNVDGSQFEGDDE